MVVERRRSWSFESISIWLSPGFVTHPQSHVSALNLFSVWITNARVHAKVGQIEIDYNLSLCKHLAKSVLDIILRKRSLSLSIQNQMSIVSCWDTHNISFSFICVFVAFFSSSHRSLMCWAVVCGRCRGQTSLSSLCLCLDPEKFGFNFTL